MKKWYTYTRNEIIYVQFKDRRTGKKLTAKSTGTRIKSEAEYIIQQWYYDPDSFFNQGQKDTAKNILYNEDGTWYDGEDVRQSGSGTFLPIAARTFE